MSEKCQRCGEEGEDRRTLVMACFYKMSELGLPFKMEEVFNIEEKKLKRYTKKRHYKVRTYDPIRQRMEKTRKHVVDVKVVKARGIVTPLDEYTLRVCKNCRADWMSAIQDWFNSKPWQDNPLPCNSGIFVRKNGANVEITEGEWFRTHPGQSPARVKRNG